MTAYVDSSVLLRVVLSQHDRLSEWPHIQKAVTSSLTEVECLRTLDRRARQGLLDPAELAERRVLALRLLERIDQVELSPGVLRRGARATLDGQLAVAARAAGFATIGA